MTGPVPGAGPLLPAAVLFDMDGLLVETEHIWYAAETRIMEAFEVDWGPEHQAALVGGPVEKAVDYMVEHAGEPHTHAEVLAMLVASMERLMRTEPVHWRPGARRLLLALEQAGVPCALVSASWRNLVDAVCDAVLHEVGHGVFATTVASGELPRTKPFPDPYLLAAERLGVEPAHCVVLEDSHTGVTAGMASGALVVGVPSLVPIEPQAGLRVVGSLEDLTPELLGAWSHEWAPRAAAR
ncbi:MAG: HAD-IA family hydrolase [Frankiales bacterium]|nr:HAD-IA family hydrolase [Frankiales bacterium]